MRAALLVLFGFLSLCAIAYGALDVIAGGFADGQVGVDEGRVGLAIAGAGLLALLGVAAVAILTRKRAA